MPALSLPELTRLSVALARALSIDDVNQVGRDTGQGNGGYPGVARRPPLYCQPRGRPWL